MRISDWSSDVCSSDLDQKKADALGLKPIAPELAKIDALKSRQDLPALLAQLDLIGVGAFRSSIQPDAKDSSRYIVYVDQGGTLLPDRRSEEHTSELQSLMRISYAVFCLKKKNHYKHPHRLIV